jgi:hypothetical protein
MNKHSKSFVIPYEHDYFNDNDGDGDRDGNAIIFRSLNSFNNHKNVDQNNNKKTIINHFSTKTRSKTFIPNVNNNSPFQMIKTNLANNHQKLQTRPDFDGAGITRIPQPKLIAKDFTDNKFTKT